MEPLIKMLVGQKVTVFSTGGQQDARDTAMLDTFDDRWVRLRDDHGKYLYLNIDRIRLIKPA